MMLCIRSVTMATNEKTMSNYTRHRKREDAPIGHGEFLCRCVVIGWMGGARWIRLTLVTNETVSLFIFPFVCVAEGKVWPRCFWLGPLVLWWTSVCPASAHTVWRTVVYFDIAFHFDWTNRNGEGGIPFHLVAIYFERCRYLLFIFLLELCVMSGNGRRAELIG